MEITNIKENVIPPLVQESTSDRVRKFEKLNEQTNRSAKTEQLFSRIAKGDPEAAKNLTDEAIQDLAARVNQVAQSMQYQLQFVVNRESGGVVIKVLDNEGKLIRQIPPEIMAAVSSKTGIDLGFLLNTEL